MRLSSRLGVTQRVASIPFNLTISNVPGPRQPLYMAGAQLQHQFPVSIVTDGQGLNITVVSYLDRLDFGLIADRELIPDLWDLADDLINEITVLKEAYGHRVGGRAVAALPAPAAAPAAPSAASSCRRRWPAPSPATAALRRARR